MEHELIFGILIGFIGNFLAGLVLDKIKPIDIERLNQKYLIESKKAEIRHKRNLQREEQKTDKEMQKLRLSAIKQNFKGLSKDLSALEVKLSDTFQNSNLIINNTNTISFKIIYNYSLKQLKKLKNEDNIYQSNAVSGIILALMDNVAQDALEASKNQAYYRPEKTINFILSQTD